MQLIGPCKKCKSFVNVYENGDEVLKNPELMICDSCIERWAASKETGFFAFIMSIFGKGESEKQKRDGSSISCPHCGYVLLWSEDRGAHCDGCDDFDPQKDLPSTMSLGMSHNEVLVCVREPRSEDSNEHGQVEAWNVDLGKFEKRFWFDFASHPLWSEEQRAEIIRKWPKWRKISVAQSDGTK